MRLILYCTYVPADEIVAVAVEAERLGFDGISFPDHVVYPIGHDSPYLYTSDGHTPWDETTDWPDPFVVAGAVAAATTRLQLLTGILVLPLRHPLLTAKAVATIDVLSRGRMSLGIGVGWLREEFEALGLDYAARGRATDEAIGVLRAVWNGRPASHDGPLYRFDALTVRPVPTRPVPIYVGGASAAAVRRAGTLGDGFLPPVTTHGGTQDLIERVHEVRAAAGRDGEPFDVIASAVAARTAEEVHALSGLGVHAVRVDPFALYEREYGGLTLDRRRAALERYAREVITPLRA
jgi:probable F420-dependent oxidoreductase